MSELPIPLVPPEVDLRDFAFMPLDVDRLRDSDLAALESPEACWVAVLLWCASWHQVPAASIPDDDRVLANLAGFGRVVKEWQRLREGALRGWVLCNDGRLYHPVVAEKALDAWTSKLRQRWSTECARIKKHQQRHNLPIALPEFEAWRAAGCPQGQPLNVPEDTGPESPGTGPIRPQSVPRETPSKGQGEGQGQGQRKEIQGAQPVATTSRVPVEAEGHQPTKAGLACRAMKEAGLASTNPGDPRLIALCDQGATLEEFSGLAAEAVAKAKGFAWVLVVLEARRREAAELQLAPQPTEAWDATRTTMDRRAQQLGVETWGDFEQRHVTAGHVPSFAAWERLLRDADAKAGAKAA